MSTLAQEFLGLSADEKRRVHFILCEHALAKWDEYSKSRGQIRYTETVCGTDQIVDNELPADAFHSARNGSDLGNVGDRYREPIAAMQDDDLQFFADVECAYYSLYNLFRKYTGLEAIDDWLIVNQALSSEAEADESKWRSLLQEAMTRPRQ